MKILITICICFIFDNVLSQNCNCSQRFDYVVGITEKVYSGFPDKVNEDTIEKYKKLTKTLKNKAQRISNQNDCYYLIKEWLLFFNDKHLYLRNIKGIINGVSFEQLTQENLLKYIQNPKKETDKLEGFWTNGKTKMGIMKYSSNTYIARWFGNYDVKIKMVKKKHNYDLTYFFPDSTLFYTTFDLNEDSNLIKVSYPYERYWIKCDSAFTYKKEINKSIIKYGLGQDPYYSKLEKDVNYIRLGSMRGEYKIKIDSLITQNWQSLTSTENLIIDVRTNGGGNDDTYYSLISLLYSQPFWFQGGTFYNEEHKKNWDDQYKNLDSIVFKKTEYPKKLYDQFKVSEYPKKIVILIDDGTASSGETFLQIARQSIKVSLLGQNTMGMLDYGNVRSFKDKCVESPLIWNIPTLKIVHFDGNQVDNIGIKPKIMIPKSEKDWVQFAINYLKTN
jgi:hypothetical protein